jgi:outer membrane lipoprotein carrier protein
MKSLMKKQLLMGSILLVASSQVWADAASDLKELSSVNVFSATFAQTVYDSKGKELQKRRAAPCWCSDPTASTGTLPPRTRA